MVVAGGKGIPIGLEFVTAMPHESTLIERTLDAIRVPRQEKERPRKRFLRLIYDKAGRQPSAPQAVEERTIDRFNLSTTVKSEGQCSRWTKASVPSPQVGNRESERLASEFSPVSSSFVSTIKLHDIFWLCHSGVYNIMITLRWLQKCFYLIQSGAMPGQSWQKGGKNGNCKVL